MCIDEFNGDNFDHGPHLTISIMGRIVGGGHLGQVQTNRRPIETTPVPSGTPKWRTEWKNAVADYYLSSLKGVSIHGTRDRARRPVFTSGFIDQKSDTAACGGGRPFLWAPNAFSSFGLRDEKVQAQLLR